MSKSDNVEQYLPTYKEDFKKDPRWLSRHSEHYSLFYLPNSEAENDILTIEKVQEAGFSKIVKFLGVQPPRQKIEYYFYPDTEIKKKLMGDDWYAQAILKDFVVHVLYTTKDKPIGEHEDTHLLSIPWGLSIGLFQEGLAEYMVGKNWYGQDHDEVAARAIKDNVLPNLKDMMEHKKWLDLDDTNAVYYYGMFGSFTKFLINTFGKDRFELLYKKTNRNKSAAENMSVFENIYKISIDQVESIWKEHLESIPTPSRKAQTPQ